MAQDSNINETDEEPNLPKDYQEKQILHKLEDLAVNPEVQKMKHIAQNLDVKTPQSSINEDDSFIDF